MRTAVNHFRHPKVPESRKPQFWRKDVPEVVDGRVVKGGMWHHQRLWWEQDHFIRLLVGGYGSGKTLILCKWATAMSFVNSPYLVGLVSPSYNIARQTTIATLEELLRGKERIFDSSVFAWRYNKTSHVFTIQLYGRTAYIQIYSGDNPDSLRGPNMAAAGIDEPFIQDIKVFEQMIARIRHPDARLQALALTGTPEQLNWGWELAEGELGERYDVGVVHADTRENKALADAYAQRLLEGYDEQAAKAYVKGQFVQLGKGLVYHQFDPSNHIVRLPQPSSARLFAGMDFNVDPMAIAIFWRRGNHIHCFKEVELPNSDTEDACVWLKDHYWGGGLRKIYPDPTGRRRSTSARGGGAGQSDFTLIEEAGFEIETPSHPWPRRDRYNAVNGKLKPREGKITLTIDPSCRKLRRYLSSYTHEDMNKDSHKAMGHLLDAFSYPIVYQFPIQREWGDAVKFQ